MRKTTLIAFAGLVLAGCDSDGDGTRPVPRPNTAPVVSAINDVETSANVASTPIAFTVSDEFPNSVQLSVLSDRPGVVPAGNIVFGGSGANRSLTVTPVIDVLGDTMLTVIATDSLGLSAGSSFLLTVVPQQRGVAEFTRENFPRPATSAAAPINAVEFNNDAENDDFADLLQ